MSASVDDIILAVCPGLAAASNKATFVELATGRTSSEFYGSNYSLAIALRASHIWVLSVYRAGGSGGAVTSESENGQSRSYAVFPQTGKYPDLSQTQFGLQLIGVMMGSGPSMGVVTGPDKPAVPPVTYFPAGGGPLGPW